MCSPPCVSVPLQLKDAKSLTEQLTLMTNSMTLWVSSGQFTSDRLGGRFRPVAASQSSVSVLSHGYFPKKATNKKIKPAKKLAKSIKSGLRSPSCRALNAIAANPRTPSTPLTTRMNGEILSCLLSVYDLGNRGLQWVSCGHCSRNYATGWCRSGAAYAAAQAPAQG